jgi:hypothetical protein
MAGCVSAARALCSLGISRFLDIEHIARLTFSLGRDMLSKFHCLEYHRLGIGHSDYAQVT